MLVRRLSMFFWCSAIEHLMAIFFTVSTSTELSDSWEMTDWLKQEFPALVFSLIPEHLLIFFMEVSWLGFSNLRTQTSSEPLLALVSAVLDKDLFYFKFRSLNLLTVFIYPECFSDPFQLQLLDELLGLKEKEVMIGSGTSTVFLSWQALLGSAAEYFLSFLN